MSEPKRNEENHVLQRAVHLREERRERWQREGERSLWQNISMIGALGWLVVIPTLLGAFIGRWLDGIFDSGVFFSSGLIFVGVCIGCYLAWRRITKE